MSGENKSYDGCNRNGREELPRRHALTEVDRKDGTYRDDTPRGESPSCWRDVIGRKYREYCVNRCSYAESGRVCSRSPERCADAGDEFVRWTERVRG